MYDQLQKAIYQLPAGNGQPKSIFIAGLGGSGKTELSRKLADLLGNNCIPFHTDWFLQNPTAVRKERIQQALTSGDSEKIEREENPQNWYNWKELRNALKVLLANGRVSIENAWNQETGLKDLTINLVFHDKEKGIILCDGIYLLDPGIIDLADLIFSLRVSYEEIVKRTQARDGHRSSQDYLAYKKSLLEKYDLPYYRKYEMNADVIIDNSAIYHPQIIERL